MSQEEPKIIYVAGRTFWDWLAEVERPRISVSLNVVAIALCVLFIIGDVFFCCWFQEFGAQWAKGAVFFACFILGIIALALGFWRLIGDPP